MQSLKLKPSNNIPKYVKLRLDNLHKRRMLKLKNFINETK